MAAVYGDSDRTSRSRRIAVRNAPAVRDASQFATHAVHDGIAVRAACRSRRMPFACGSSRPSPAAPTRRGSSATRRSGVTYRRSSPGSRLLNVLQRTPTLWALGSSRVMRRFSESTSHTRSSSKSDDAARQPVNNVLFTSALQRSSAQPSNDFCSSEHERGHGNWQFPRLLGHIGHHSRSSALDDLYDGLRLLATRKCSGLLALTGGPCSRCRARRDCLVAHGQTPPRSRVPVTLISRIQNCQCRLLNSLLRAESHL
jgi:hypothetical protein